MAKRDDTMPASEFKARCLAVMDEVEATGREVTITKRGRPVARLVPVVAENKRSFGRLAGTVTYHGDIVGPFHDVWDVDGDAD